MRTKWDCRATITSWSVLGGKLLNAIHDWVREEKNTEISAYCLWEEGGKKKEEIYGKGKKHVKIARIGTNKSDDGKFSFD